MRDRYPKDKDEYIEMEREHDEEKRRKFLEEREKAKQKAADDAAPKPKGLREKISAYREERRYKGFKKEEDKKVRTEQVKQRQEERTFGKKLSPEEKAKFEKYKQEQRDKQARRRTAIKKGFEKAKDYGEAVASSAEEMQNNMASTSLGPRRDIGDRPRGGGRVVGNVRDPVAELFTMGPMGAPAESIGQRPTSGADPLVDMFSLKGIGGVPMPRAAVTAARDPLADFFAIRTPAEEPKIDSYRTTHKGGFSKRDDVGDANGVGNFGAGLGDFSGLFKKPDMSGKKRSNSKHVKQGGLYDDLFTPR